MKNKKILFFLNSFGLGGAERVCDNYAKEYLNQGFEVHFITLYKESDYVINENYKVINLDIDKNISSTNKIIQILKKRKIVNNYLKKHKFSLITANLPFSQLLARLTKINKKCIYVQHSTLSNDISIKYRKVLNIIFRKRKIVAVSKNVGKELINDFKFKEKYVTTIYNPLLLEEIKKLKKEKTDNIKPYILFVGRLEKVKRPERMLETFYKGKFYKEYKLVILGSGSLLEKLKKIAKNYNIEKDVIFKGYTPNVYSYMSRAKALVVTSDSESFSMVLLEALACGCKVISSNCKYGPSEILTGELSKYLVNNIADIEEYIKVLKDALNNYPNIDNINIFDKFEINNLTKKYIDFYRREVK